MASLTLLGSASRAATTSSAQFTWNQPKAYCVLDVTAVAATPSIVLSLEVYDPVSGQYVTIFTATTAVTATGTKTYCLTDTSFAPTGVTETKQCYMTDTMRVTVTHADADAITYSVSFVEVLSRFPALL